MGEESKIRKGGERGEVASGETFHFSSNANTCWITKMT